MEWVHVICIILFLDTLYVNQTAKPSLTVFYKPALKPEHIRYHSQLTLIFQDILLADVT